MQIALREDGEATEKQKLMVHFKIKYKNDDIDREMKYFNAFLNYITHILLS